MGEGQAMFVQRASELFDAISTNRISARPGPFVSADEHYRSAQLANEGRACIRGSGSGTARMGCGREEGWTTGSRSLPAIVSHLGPGKRDEPVPGNARECNSVSGKHLPEPGRCPGYLDGGTERPRHGDSMPVCLQGGQASG